MNLALHPSEVTYCGNVASVGWQVTLCDPVWHVSSRSVWQVRLRTAISVYFALHRGALSSAAITSVRLSVCPTPLAQERYILGL